MSVGPEILDILRGSSVVDVAEYETLKRWIEAVGKTSCFSTMWQRSSKVKVEESLGKRTVNVMLARSHG